MKLFLHKLTHWEYWPFQIVYIPVYFQWLWYGIRARSIFFFNASNPSIKNGGFFMESKKEIYDLIPQEFYPRTVRLNACSSFNSMKAKIEAAGISYPFIVKPDIGQRGSAVKRVNTPDELVKYAGKGEFDFLAQDLIPYANEVGIFYVRFPNEREGKITGIVSKEFLIVTGNGRSTMEELIKKDPRYEMQLKPLKREYAEKLNEILADGEKRNLVPYGNHIRGAKFIDASHLISPALTKTMNDVCLQIPGFYFGRLDVMYDSWEKLERGQNFQLVEVNGAASEPTHIYDPKHSIFFAWKELTRHIGYMFRISVANHKKGAPYLSFRHGMAEYRANIENNKKIGIF
ncbi:MAG: D-alanine--D-alanine ligase [Flavobacterium sp.]|nr:MAG: D-alanine--D-alanine ligase [Flavobacterium sp.]